MKAFEKRFVTSYNYTEQLVMMWYYQHIHDDFANFVSNVENH